VGIEGARPASTALNGICPYFTMFPLNFPYDILRAEAEAGEAVLDPFCGRGTTNYAARLLGLPSAGIDSSPVAVAIAQAKLANTRPVAIIRAARRILEEVAEPADVPEGEFWSWAYHPQTLRTLCRLREGLLRDCRSDARRALRAILLGALHGPRPKSRPAYFSNQSQRTYAPKPAYAVRFWQARGLRPEPVDVLDIVAARAERYFGAEASRAVGIVRQGDSRRQATLTAVSRGRRFHWVITSPPYYGMRTYLPDQWLRAWFLGGPPHVDYSMAGQLAHSGPEVFADQLRQVWANVGAVCAPGARMVIRFGAINDRKVEPLPLLLTSLAGSGWEVLDVRPAGTAARGRRQALHFARTRSRALEEHDVRAVWCG